VKRVKNIIKKIVDKLRLVFDISISRELTIASNSKVYKHIAKEWTFVRPKDTKLAVVIHLFYVDSWPLFLSKLANLGSFKFDIFITMPVSNAYFIKEIKKSYPKANVITVPNQGRDVLPFIQVAKELSESGYESVLKLHSKKSTHRDDGQEWLNDMLESLLPQSQDMIDDIINKLSNKETGVIGPEGVYYPLTVNFPANGKHMTKVIEKLYDNHLAYEYLQLKRADYGFFGGTMFWVRLDAIDNLLDFPVRCFETETGQVDGTFAHALERLFCVVVEIDKKNNYEITKKGVVNRPYRSINIPEWSDLYLKDKL